jgi:hypothetical protein
MIVSWIFIVCGLALNTHCEIIKQSRFPIDPSTFKRYNYITNSRVKSSERALNDTAPVLNATEDGSSKPKINMSEAEELVLTLRDIEKLTNYVSNIQAQLNEKIMGDLENLLLVNNLEQSYQMYDFILGIRRNYFANKLLLNRKAQFIKAIVLFAVDFVQTADPLDMELVIPEEDIDADIQNKLILLQLLERLKDTTNLYEEGIVKGLGDKFSQIDTVHRNATLADSEKIHMLIDSCVDLVVFKKQQVDAQAEDIITLKNLIIQNPKYKELVYQPELEIQNASYLGRAWLLGVSLVLILISF